MEDIENKIEKVFNDKPETEFIFMKDAYNFYLSEKDFYKNLEKKYDVKYVYLARHPKLVQASWNSLMLKSKERANGDFSNNTYKACYYDRKLFFNKFIKLLEDFPGYCVDVEDLIADIDNQMKSYCNFLGIKYKTEYLTWEPFVNTDKMPYNIKSNSNYDLFFGTALTSIGLNSNRSSLENCSVPEMIGKNKRHQLMGDWNDEVEGYIKFNKIAKEHFEKYKPKILE